MIPLANLNGINGFKILGGSPKQSNGYSVSAAGDINGDGYADMLIGEPQCGSGSPCGSGSSYVVFGGGQGR